MKSNDFIKQHITIDDRLRISKKINNLSIKYKEFGNYLEMIQKENVAKLFIHLKLNGYLIQSMVKGDVQLYSFRHYVNVLCASNFIEVTFPNKDQLEQVSEAYNDYIASKTTYFSLTQKGEDFLNIDIIKEYLETEYEDYQNELLQ